MLVKTLIFITIANIMCSISQAAPATGVAEESPTAASETDILYLVQEGMEFMLYAGVMTFSNEAPEVSIIWLWHLIKMRPNRIQL